MDKLRIGMISCGQIATAQADGIESSQHGEIAAVLDDDHAAAKEMAAKYGVDWHADLWEFLDRTDLDAVYIATPHMTHAPLTVFAARSGRHVMVEKPMATDADDGKSMIRACREARVTFSVVMPMRYSWAIQKGRELLGSGVIGDIVCTRILELSEKDDDYWVRGVRAAARPSTWRGFKGTAGGGRLIMNTVHTIDAIRWVTGLTAAEVMAYGGTFASPVAVEDAISAVLQYESGGAFGVIEAMACAKGGHQGTPGWWIHGTEGQIRSAGRDSVDVYTALGGEGLKAGEWQTLSAPQDSDAAHPRRDYVDDFAAAVQEDRAPFITGEDGLAVLRTILSAYLAAKTKRPLKPAHL